MHWDLYEYVSYGPSKPRLHRMACGREGMSPSLVHQSIQYVAANENKLGQITCQSQGIFAVHFRIAIF